MKRYSRFVALTLIVSATLLACNSNRNPLSSIIDSPLSVDPPFTSLAIGCNSNMVSNEKGGEILYETGSKVTIPADAFVDKNGKPIEGKVQVNFREFHNNAEIMVSGIPMNFKSESGEYENFQSAGMFEITAEHNGEEVFVAEGKQITCETITHEQEENYNFYYYDKELEQWVEQSGQDMTVKNADSLGREESSVEDLAETRGNTIEDLTTKPLKPKLADESLPIFEIGDPEGTETDTDVQAIGRVSRSALWQFAPGYKISKEAMDKVLSESKWDNYSLKQTKEREDVYRLDLGRGYQTPIYITPVLFGKDYRKAMAKYSKELKAFNEQANEITAARNFVEKKDEFWRVARVSGLGLFNWDRIKGRKDAVQLQASFELEGGEKIPANTRVFMITGDNKEIITFYPGMFANFAFIPKEKNTLVAVLPGDEMGVFTHDAFQKLQPGKLRRKGEHKFTLKRVIANIATVSDLQKFLDTL